MTCPICKAKISQLNDIASVRLKEIEKESLQFGLSVLHAYIRCFECLLHIAYRLELKVWKVSNLSLALISVLINSLIDIFR